MNHLQKTARDGCLPDQGPCKSIGWDTKRPLTVLGGDARQIAVAVCLSEQGYDVRYVGESDVGNDLRHSYREIKTYRRFDRAMESAGGVILPYPATKDGTWIYSPLNTELKLSLQAVSDHLSSHPDMLLFGGRMPTAYTEFLRARGCRVYDYEDSETLLQRNARLTAEGAIMLAMEVTDIGWLGAQVAVIGYGRIGRSLSQLMRSLGADVTVFARREESLQSAREEGCQTAYTSAKAGLCTGYDVIFNTVPALLLDRETLAAMPCKTLILELASAPGGLDPEGAREATRRCGLQIIYAPALPGRYAPWDAGSAIAAYITDVLKNASSEEVKV